MITELIDALIAGRQLRNSVGVKNVQVKANLIAAILGAVLAALSLVGVHPLITPDQIVAISGGIAAVLSVFNAYATVATTDKLGVPPRDGDTDSPTDPGKTDMG